MVGYSKVKFQPRGGVYRSTAQAGMAALMLQIEQGQSGFNSTLEGPYGTKRGTYSYKYLVNHMAAY